MPGTRRKINACFLLRLSHRSSLSPLGLHSQPLPLVAPAPTALASPCPSWTESSDLQAPVRASGGQSRPSNRPVPLTEEIGVRLLAVRARPEPRPSTPPSKTGEPVPRPEMGRGAHLSAGLLPT